MNAELDIHTLYYLARVWSSENRKIRTHFLPGYFIISERLEKSIKIEIFSNSRLMPIIVEMPITTLHLILQRHKIWREKLKEKLYYRRGLSYFMKIEDAEIFMGLSEREANVRLKDIQNVLLYLLTLV
ncbi:MAG: hypothetical protein Solivirus2_52 [Solivirus sp.]|uniref:Uncharacterized protein n=1 Tax=Solivirus sp. TaxID=2487772 RepID=A0A3G5AI52_9VIRU|nr:MAG: hypothetical protein Solivirus2_52 [Solivirus sp.]